MATGTGSTRACRRCCWRCCCMHARRAARAPPPPRPRALAATQHTLMSPTHLLSLLKMKTQVIIALLLLKSELSTS